MFFNNWHALLQARVAATDFARNKHVAFFRGEVPTLPQTLSTSEFSDLVTTRLADWVCTMASSRTITIRDTDTLTNFDDASEEPMLIGDERLKGLDYDSMVPNVRTSLALGGLVGSISDTDSLEDYTPTWFIVTTPHEEAPFISSDTTDIDFIGEVTDVRSSLTGAVLLKRQLSAGTLPRPVDFTMINLPI